MADQRVYQILVYRHELFNRPSPYGDRRFIKRTWLLFCFFLFLIFFFFFWRQCHDERSAVKLVVRVLKRGTILYKTHALISLVNVTFVCSCLLSYSI